MNNYVVARNALIASIFILTFIVSLQPQKLSNAVLGISNAVSTRLVSERNITAAESDNMEALTLHLTSADILLPRMEGTVVDEKGNAAIVSLNENSKFIITVEDYKDSASSKAVQLAEKLKADSEFTNISVQPVLRGGNMFYEVSSKEQYLHYAVIKVADGEALTVVPSPEVEKKVVNKMLSGLKFE